MYLLGSAWSQPFPQVTLQHIFPVNLLRVLNVESTKLSFPEENCDLSDQSDWRERNALEVFQPCAIDYMLLDKRNISAFIKVKAAILKHMRFDFSCSFALPQNTHSLTAPELLEFYLQPNGVVPYYSREEMVLLGAIYTDPGVHWNRSRKKLCLDEVVLKKKKIPVYTNTLDQLNTM